MELNEECFGQNLVHRKYWISQHLKQLVFSMPVHAISVLNDTGIQIKIDSFRIEHTYLQDGFLLSAQTTSTPQREREGQD